MTSSNCVFRRGVTFGLLWRGAFGFTRLLRPRQAGITFRALVALGCALGLGSLVALLLLGCLVAFRALVGLGFGLFSFSAIDLGSRTLGEAHLLAAVFAPS